MKPIFRNEEKRLRTGWRLLVFIILLSAIVIAVNVSWRALGLPGRTVDGVVQSWTFLWFTLIITGSALGLVLSLLRYFEKRGPDAIGMPFDRRFFPATFAGLLIGALPIVLLVGLALAAGYGEVRMRSIDLSQLAGSLVPMLAVGFALAAWEEFVLRGYIFRQLSLGINPVAAVLITGVAFGLLHSGNPGANWQGLLYTAIGGILMGGLLLRTGSLWLLIGYHFGWNATASAVFGLELSGFEEGASILSSTLSGADWQTGGNYGFEASVPAVIFEILVLSAAIYLAGKGTNTHAIQSDDVRA